MWWSKARSAFFVACLWWNATTVISIIIANTNRNLSNAAATNVCAYWRWYRAESHPNSRCMLHPVPKKNVVKQDLNIMSAFSSQTVGACKALCCDFIFRTPTQHLRKTSSTSVHNNHLFSLPQICSPSLFFGNTRARCSSCIFCR